MEVNLQVKDLIHCLPHRPPMVWINRITEVGGEYKSLYGTCVVDLDSDSLYVNNKKELRASSAIEFTAQGFGYLKAAWQVTNDMNDPPKETYLTGVRSCWADFSQVNIDQINQLQVKLKVVRELLPLTYVKGEISILGSDKTLAEAEIQVYVD